MSDLFGSIDLTEEINVEEVNNDGGSGEPTSKQSKHKDEENSDIKITDLNNELIDVLDEEENTNISEENNDKSPSSKDKSGNSSSPDYKPIAELSKILHDDGVLVSFDEERFAKLTEELGDPILALGETVKETVQSVHQDWVESYPKPIQDLLKAHQEGLPLQEMFDIKKNEILLEGITEEQLEDSEDLRKQILTEYFKKTTKFSEIKIKSQVSNLVDLGKDGDEAKEALKELQEISKETEKQIKIEAKKQTELIQKQNTERLENLKKDVLNTKELIPGINLVQKEQNDLLKSITTIVHRTADGQALTQPDYMFSKYPVEMTKLFHYYYQIGMFNIDEKTGTAKPDIKKITTALKTQVTKELRENVNDGRVFKSGVPGAIKDELETNARKNISGSLEGFIKNRK